jgi:hypothetical protein
VNPYWIVHHPEMTEGVVEFLPSNEVDFWNDLIDKYLHVQNKDAVVSVIICVVHFPTLNMPIFKGMNNFKHLGITLAKQTALLERVKCRWHSLNACWP